MEFDRVLSPNSIELHSLTTLLGSSTTSGIVKVFVTDLDHRGSFQFSVKLTLCPVLSQANPLSSPFVFVRTVFWVAASVSASDGWQESFFYHRPDSPVPGFIRLLNLVGYSTVCSPRPFKVCGYRFYLPLAPHWLDVKKTEVLPPSPVGCQPFDLVC